MVFLVGSCTDVPPPISENAYQLNGDVNGIIHTPVETAIHRHDPAIYLLVGLGASLDVGIKLSYRGSWAKKASLLEAVEAMVKNIDMEMERLRRPAEPESMDVDHADQPEWKAWIIKSTQAIKNFEKKENEQQKANKRINELTRMKDYLEEVLGLMKEKKAKTWNQIHPDDEKKENDDNANADKQEKTETPFFSAWSSEWWAAPVLREKAPLYEELYEACWNGDDDKLRELCLPPPEGTIRKVAPIQIVCKTTEGGKSCLGSTGVDTHAIFCRLHPAACCNLSPPLVDSEDHPDHRCRSAEDKARGYYY